MTAGKGRPLGSSPPPPGKPPAGGDPSPSPSHPQPAPSSSSGSPPPPASASPRSSETPQSPSPSSSASADSPGAQAAAAASSTEPAYVHTHFASHKELHEMQPELEAADRKRALAGVTGIGAGGGDAGGTGGPARWAYMYDGLQARLSSALFRPLRMAVRTYLASGPIEAVQQTSEEVVRDCVERNFDAQEFLEGVHDAVGAFYEALGSKDEEALRRMASEQVVEAVKRDRQALLANKRVQLTSVKAAASDAVLGQVSLWGPDSVRAFDAAWADSVTADTSKSWLVMTVFLDVKLECEYQMPGVGPFKTGDGESVLPVLGTTLQRRGTWLFARGPLPRGVSNSLPDSCRWKVLGWW